MNILEKNDTGVKFLVVAHPVQQVLRPVSTVMCRCIETFQKWIPCLLCLHVFAAKKSVCDNDGTVQQALLSDPFFTQKCVFTDVLCPATICSQPLVCVRLSFKHFMVVFSSSW